MPLAPGSCEGSMDTLCASHHHRVFLLPLLYRIFPEAQEDTFPADLNSRKPVFWCAVPERCQRWSVSFQFARRRFDASEPPKCPNLSKSNNTGNPIKKGIKRRGERFVADVEVHVVAGQRIGEFLKFLPANGWNISGLQGVQGLIYLFDDFFGRNSKFVIKVKSTNNGGPFRRRFFQES